jgi:cyclic pyranopterin phosphate synthase
MVVIALDSPHKEHTPTRRIPLPVLAGPELAPAAQPAPPEGGPLVDSFGRLIRNLRVSITDRCNFRCTYCMPEEGLDWLPRHEILSYEEIERLVALFVRLGIEEVRLTGGEPTVRKDLPTLVRMLAPLRPHGLRSLSITTNGILLHKLAGPLAEAGLTRINVSLDTLDPQKFWAITRRRALDQVLQGLEVLERYPSISPIKVNAVAIRGFTTEADVLALAELARRKPYVMRFIEYMPLDAEGNWNTDLVMTGEELRQIVHTRWPLEPVGDIDPSSTSLVFRFADGQGEMGFINPVSQPFCATCDRIRLTADGQLRTCLFSIDETDLKGPLRAGATDAQLEQVIRRAVWGKEKKHKINEGDAFQRASRSMSQIGG